MGWHKVSKEELDLRVGWVTQRITSGGDRNGKFKMLEFFAHPMTGEQYFAIHDINDVTTKFETLDGAITFYNDL